MQHSHRYQHFALDASNNIVDIKNVHDDQQYFCPHCHKEMITKRGKIRQWHFAYIFRSIPVHFPAAYKA